MSAVEAVDTSRPLPAAGAAELALQGLYERHFERIFGFCLRRLRNRSEAEDAVQTTFLQAFRALQRGVVPICEHAWLFKIAENVCLSTHRSNGRRREHELGDDPDAVDGLTAAEDDSDIARELRRALAALPETQRRALLLREWRGMSYREIATQLGTSVAAVETLIFRARRGVARMLGESGVKDRLTGALNLGSLFGSLKAALGGATAAQVAAAAAVVTVATLPAGDTARVTPQAAADRVEAASVGQHRDAVPGAGSRYSPDGGTEPTSRADDASGRSRANGVPAPDSKSGTGAPGGTARPGTQPEGAIPGGTAPGVTAPGGAPPGGASSDAPAPGKGLPNLPEAPSLPNPPVNAPPPPPLVPPVEVPPLPPLPELPLVPELPAPQVPAVPQLPPLPVVPPNLDETINETLPKLP